MSGQYPLPSPAVAVFTCTGAYELSEKSLEQARRICKITRESSVGAAREILKPDIAQDITRGVSYQLCSAGWATSPPEAACANALTRKSASAVCALLSSYLCMESCCALNDRCQRCWLSQFDKWRGHSLLPVPLQRALRFTLSALRLLLCLLPSTDTSFNVYAMHLGGAQTREACCSTS